MSENVSNAIDSNALHAKSKVYIGRALRSKDASEFDEYQLWASLALELLGKAALAKLHPCLVVDPSHWQSLFIAAGIDNETTDVKTITAKTLFERLGHLVPWFDKAVQKFCEDITQRRNSELHSGALPFRTMNLEAWEERYWHACDTILQEIGDSLNYWLGAAEAAAPRRLLDEAAKAHVATVKIRVQSAREQFKKLKSAERERAVTETQLLNSQQRTALFKGIYDESWVDNCPACNCLAFMAGNQIGEYISEERDEMAIWELVDREFMGEEFHCPTCKLSLMGSAEIDAAELNYIHVDQQERDIEHDPKNGND